MAGRVAVNEAGRQAVQRWLVLGTVAAVPLLRWRTLSDAFSLIKLLAIVVAALGVVGAGLAGRHRDVDWRRLVPGSVYGRLVAALLAVLALSTLLADDVGGALTGPYRRWNGWLLHAAAAALALVVAARFQRRDVRLVLRIQAGTAVIIAIHGILQWAGWVDQSVVTLGAPVVATLGNSNFVAAYLAIATPALVLELLEVDDWRRRGGVGVALAVVLWATLLTKALQGPVAVAAGVGVGGVAWLWGRRRREAIALSAAGATGVGLIMTGLIASTGPFAFLSAERSFELRGYYWAAALRMFGDHPVLGIGPGRYVRYFREARGTEAALDVPPGLEVDAAHNVFLDMLAGGGIFAGLLTVAIVVLIVVLATRTARNGASLLQAAVIGAWVAWFAQALVSVETPVLVLSGWVLGGAVVAVTRPQAEAAPTSRHKKKRKRPTQPARVDVPVMTAAALAAPAVVIGLIWLSADSQAALSLAAQRSELGEQAREHAANAAGRAGWISQYHINLGNVLGATGDDAGALAAYEAAARVDGRDTRAWVGIARAKRALNDRPGALDAYERIFELDPNQPTLYVEAALIAVAADDVGRATAFADRAAALAPEDPEAWVAVGYARNLVNDVDAAIEALAKARDLGSEDARALALLDELQA